MKLSDTNIDGMTLGEWYAAARISDRHYHSLGHETQIKTQAMLAWERGEDPTEYWSDHSLLEKYYCLDCCGANSLRPFHKDYCTGEYDQILDIC
jgi:hypothetical protein